MAELLGARLLASRAVAKKRLISLADRSRKSRGHLDESIRAWRRP
jgi:hypothetical protein